MGSKTGTTATRPESAAPCRELSLFDSVCIIGGVIIGAGIYESTPLVAQNVSSAGVLVLAWLLGGLLSLIGALCYAELATAYPREGGDYVYLTEALGRRCGFLFAWAQLWVVRPGSIGAMAYVFARYANQLFPLGDGPSALVVYAVAAIAVLTGINLLGIHEGRWTQNVLTTVKFLGLGIVCVVGLFLGGTTEQVVNQSATTVPDFGQAMIFVLFVFGGWNEMAYVGAEVRNPRKNILRALVLGTLAVTAIYLLANLAFLRALGFEQVRHSTDVAGEVLQQSFGRWSSRFIQLLIAVSALGAIQGMIFTGARIYYAMGQDHRLYAWLGRWNSRHGTPIQALLIQSAITLALVVGFGWTKGGFSALVNFTTPVFWIFFCLVAASLIVLRYRQPQLQRPYRVPMYPIVPLIFCLSCLFMVYASLSWAIKQRSYEALWAVGLMGLGIILTFWSRNDAALNGSRSESR